MALLNFNKPKIEDIPMAKAEPKPEIPLPPKFNIPDQAILNRFTDLEEQLNTILDNQKVIFQEIQKLTNPTIIPSLDEVELSLIPEEDKDFYLDMKQNNPKMAETLLKGYKVKSK